MSHVRNDVATLLNEIERHVAWMYSTALEVAAGSASEEDHERLLRRILQISERFRDAAPRLRNVAPEADDMLDLAVVLGRAIDHWNDASAQWHASPGCAALSAAAAELVTVAESLNDALAPAPSGPDDNQDVPPAYAPSPRKVQ